MELSQVKEGINIVFNHDGTKYKGIIIGKYGTDKLKKDSSILVQSNEFRYGHGGQGGGFKLDNSKLEDIAGRNRYFVNIQNLHLDIDPKSTQPEQQFITGVSLKLRWHPAGLLSQKTIDIIGTTTKITSYGKYIDNEKGYFVNIEGGYVAYECNFEAFEGSTVEESIKINPSNYKEVGIDPSIKEYKTYPTAPKESILTPIVNSTPSIAEPEIKVKLDTTLFIGKKLPTLNTNF